MPTTLHIVTVVVRKPQTNVMPAHQIDLSAGRSAQRHYELPRRRLRLQPEHYIKRDSGELIPLVPVDELPLEFYGLPRSLSSVDNSRMIFLGQKGPWTGYYRMKQPKAFVLAEQPGTQSNPPSDDAQPSKTNRRLSGDSIGRLPTPEPVALDATSRVSSEAVASQVRSRPTTLSDSRRNELCYNWIRGHCKFEPNCHRLHQMPETTEEWQDIVIRGILPRGGNPRGVANHQRVARHNKPQSDLDVLNREIVFLRQALANQSHMRKGGHQKLPRAAVSDIEARLLQKVLDDKDVKRNLEREAKLGREQGQKDAAAIGKERKEGNGTQTTSSQPIASTMEGVRTGHLVDVK